MIQFPDCFFLIFGQMAVGGFLCLSVPPFHGIERGFYKSSAGVFLAAALAMVAGKAWLLLRATGPTSSEAVAEVAAWAVFAATGGLYLYSLWGDPYRLRARAYLGTLLTGIAALAVSAARFRLEPLPSIEMVLYPLSFLASAVALGSAVTGMLLGHWYLIETKLSLLPLQRILRTFLIAVGGQLTIICLILLALFVAGAPSVTVHAPWTGQLGLIVARLALGPVAALVLALLIARTLAIPQTMAATGLFYIAVLAVAVGEMIGRLLLFRTGVPF